MKFHSNGQLLEKRTENMSAHFTKMEYAPLNWACTITVFGKRPQLQLKGSNLVHFGSHQESKMDLTANRSSDLANMDTESYMT